MTGRRSCRRRYAVSPAVTWLIKAFAPGCPTMLRSQFTKKVAGGERLALTYDLPDGKAQVRAVELAKSACNLLKVAIGRDEIRDISAAVDDDQALLTVDVLLVRK